MYYKIHLTTIGIAVAGIIFALGLSTVVSAQERLMVFAGAASKPPTEEAAAQYEKKTGTKVELVFGGSGYVLSQMKLAKQGDIYFPGSSDYMEIAKRDGDVFPETETVIVYLVPAINVQKGNPHKIKKLADLTKPGLKVAIANPEGVCVGAYAVEIIEKELTKEEKAAFKKNLINYTGSCEKTATAISLKQADAVIGWRVFEHWDPERIETIPLDPAQISRVGYIPIAISKFTKNREAAQGFIDFLLSPEGRAAFAKYHYFATPEEAFAWLGTEKPVGGERQRVALARALAPAPELLILDEPFSALNEALRRELWGLLKNLQQEYGVATLMVTHDLEEAFFFGEKVHILIDGFLHQSGPRRSVFDHPATIQVAPWYPEPSSSPGHQPGRPCHGVGPELSWVGTGH